MGKFHLVLLKKGPAWTAERTEQTKAIQEGHMANIDAMWKAKKLVLAGPMGDDGDTRADAEGVAALEAVERLKGGRSTAVFLNLNELFVRDDYALNRGR